MNECMYRGRKRKMQNEFHKFNKFHNLFLPSQKIEENKTLYKKITNDTHDIIFHIRFLFFFFIS